MQRSHDQLQILLQGVRNQEGCSMARDASFDKGGSEMPHVQDTLDTVEHYETYEDYLDSQVTDTDMYYLEDEDLARQLVELGYRGSGDTLQRDEFEARKKALRDRTTQKSNAPKQLASAGKDLTTSPFLQALANREELVRNGKLTSIVFVRDRNSKGQEVSGYIDYAHRLKSENFDAYFDKKKRVSCTVLGGCSWLAPDSAQVS